MQCEKTMMMINDYIDGELEKEKEAFLFSHIAECHSCREEFKQQSKIKHEVIINQKEVSPQFEERIFRAIKRKETTSIKKYFNRQSPNYFSYMLGGIVILILLWSLHQIGTLRADLDEFKGKYEAALFEYNSQSKRLNFLISAGSQEQPTLYNVSN